MNPTEHGTAVAIGDHGVLLTGPSGVGKSDLALRLIDRGALLVADDRVLVGAGLTLAPPDALAGKLEIRGIGVMTVPYCQSAALRLLVELGGEGERLPASWPLVDFAGWSLPCLRIDGFSPSAPVRIEYALRSIIDSGLLPTRLSAN